MKRALFFIVLLAAAPAFAGVTAVSGTVVDPNGVPYAGGTILPVFVSPGGGSPAFTATGQFYVPPTSPTQLSSTGTFALTLADNSTLSPAATQWKFIICSGAGSVAPSIGTGQQCFTTAAITISGATQSITTQINTASPPALTNTPTKSSVPYITTSTTSPQFGANDGGITGYGSGASGRLDFVTNGNVDEFIQDVSSHRLDGRIVLQWGNGGNPFNGSDVGISRCGVSYFCFGNSTANDKTALIQTGNTVRLTADLTLAGNTSLQTILTWTLPAVAANWSFHCYLPYSQATAAVADAFGIQAATNAATRIDASGFGFTNTTVVTRGVLTNLTTTTATNIFTFTPSATATVFEGYLDGTIQAGASPPTINIMASQSNAGDLLTVKAGAYCAFTP